MHATARDKAERAKIAKHNVQLAKLQQNVNYRNFESVLEKTRLEKEAELNKIDHAKVYEIELKKRLAIQENLEKEASALAVRLESIVMHLGNSDSKYDEFKCPCCLNIMQCPPHFRTPKLLHCYHTVCAHCLKRLHVYGTIYCPLCKTSYSCHSVDGLQNDAAMIRSIRVKYTPKASAAMLKLKRDIIHMHPKCHMLTTVDPLPMESDNEYTYDDT